MGRRDLGRLILFNCSFLTGIYLAQELSGSAFQKSKALISD